MKGNTKMKNKIFLIAMLVLILAFASCSKTEVADQQQEETEEVEQEVAIHLTDDNFHETIDNTEGVVIVDFWAEWCPPCLKLGPILEEISKEEEIALYKVDVDKCPATAVEFGINSIPTVYIYRDGEIVDSQIGLGNKEFYLDMINEYR